MLHFQTTVLFMSMLMAAASLVFAFLVHLYPDRPGLRHWLAGCLLLATGYALRLLGSMDAAGALFWWAGLCFLGGNLAIWLGILAFCRLRHRVPDRWIAFAFLLAWVLAAALPHAQQVAANLGLAALACGFAGLALLRAHALEERLLRWSLAGVYLVSGAVLMARALFIGFDVGSLPEWRVDELSALGAPLSAALLMLRCIALLVLLHADRETLLRGLARTDVLTGLLNRQGFFEQAARLLERHAGQRPCSVLMLDLDRFKQVNDGHGHAAGDAVLRRFAELLREQLRPGDSIGRIGGEEFSALLVDVSPQQAEEIAERLRRAWSAQPVPFGDLQLHCGVSVGIDSGDGPLESRLAAADQALYRAKQGGRNQVVASVA